MKLLDEKMVSEVLCMSKGTLRKWRSLGIGPKWVKLGVTVRYPESDLNKYIEACADKAIEETEEELNKKGDKGKKVQFDYYV